MSKMSFSRCVIAILLLSLIVSPLSVVAGNSGNYYLCAEEMAIEEEFQLMQQLLEYASNNVGSTSGSRTYEAVCSNGNVVSLTITIEPEIRGRSWEFVNFDRNTYELSPGSWVYTVSWSGTNVGNIELTANFQLSRNPDNNRQLLVRATNATANVISSPSGFTSSSSSTFSGIADATFTGVYTHTRSFPNTTRIYRIRLHAVGMLAPQGQLGTNVMFTNDLHRWST